ncbi:bacterioferritin-associated ferredoxin [Kushneria sinocarnis]|uniref:Bacterioferritin-associated ferredoxin n=1 Tax=Kushneria sinocarnis TaxID=595502 RepID=A0A420X001_9GAMM|nr:bacterioferritin-associated ferredoxin [Kushneria sinocarnis]RKR06936.1 bacterioferritin-associated ferredoxin [Kushneria sinocarnis]
MFVCLCRKVTDHQLRDAVSEGARSWQEVRRMTGCSSQCGKCACMAESIVEEALLAHASRYHRLVSHHGDLAVAATG